MDLCWIPGNLSSLAIAFLALITAIFYYYVNNKNLPPGPIGLPILGYWPFLPSKNFCSQLEALRRKYGNLYSFYSTGRLFVSLGSWKVLREAHVTHSDCFKRFEDYNPISAAFANGLSTSNGDGWRSLRKFFVQSLKEHGVHSMREHASMQEAIASTVCYLREKRGEPVSVQQLLTDLTTAMLQKTMFGESVSEQQIREINEHYHFVAGAITSTSLLARGNLGRHLILPLDPDYQGFRKHYKLMEDLLYRLVDEHKATYDPEHVRDIIDDFIRERKERDSKGDPSAMYFTDTALVGTLVQIIGDGVLTVSPFIALYVKLLLEHPLEQERIYREVEGVVGRDRLPTVGDRNRLKYTNAFILEGRRKVGFFFALFPSLQCIKETTIGGYRIPVGTITLMNMWSTQHDPEEYDQPDRFDPSRYLEEDNGKKRPELSISFGIGKRACIGETYTMMQVFLFITALVQNFHITLLNDTGKPWQEDDLNIMVKPRN